MCKRMIIDTDSKSLNTLVYKIKYTGIDRNTTKKWLPLQNLRKSSKLHCS